MFNQSMGEVTGTRIASTQSRQVAEVHEELWAEALGLGTVVESALSLSVTILCHRQTELAGEVKASEREIDRREVVIEHKCLRVLALYAPVASDFRRVLTVMQVNRTFERIGDLAVRIAKRATKLAAMPAPLTLPDPLVALSEGALAAVHDAIDALARSDTQKSRALIAADHRLDDYQREAKKYVGASIQREPNRVSEWLRLFDIAHDLERAGDHAVRIAEAVVYLTEGEIIRHERSRHTAV